MDQRTDTLCPGCFADKGQVNPCPHCGYDEALERSPLVLPHRTLLHGHFVVGRLHVPSGAVPPRPARLRHHYTEIKPMYAESLLPRNVPH